jgi:hypothetical protein
MNSESILIDDFFPIFTYSIYQAMIKSIFTIIFISLWASAFSCTNFIITKGASADGSTMMVYTNDGEWLYHLKMHSAASHKKVKQLNSKYPKLILFWKYRKLRKHIKD